MKSKEEIRNDIVRYMNFSWHGKDSKDRNPFVQLMIEELCNELYLVYNKLDNSNTSILEKLVKNLSPFFNYVRPAHSVLMVNSDEPVFHLDKKSNFFIKEISTKYQEQGINSIIFTPVCDINLNNVRINSIFFDKTLWIVNDAGEKSVLLQTNERATHNTLWLGLKADKEIKTLKDLFIYFNFPHLDDSHEYYDFLSYTFWKERNNTLKVKQGLPIKQNSSPSKIEKDILNFYKDHYQTIDHIVLSDIPTQKLPEELTSIVNPEIASSFPYLHWFSITFPPNFNPDDLMKMTIALNAFPVINRNNHEYFVSESDVSKALSLSSGIGEEFLEIDSILNSQLNSQNQIIHKNIYNTDIFTIEPKKKEMVGETKVVDYLEKLVDLLQDERTVFPKIDNDKIMEVYNSVSSLKDKENYKVEKNWLQEYTVVAGLSINTQETQEEINSLKILYWTSFAELINGIPENTLLMANKIPDLNKKDAVFLTSVRGGRNFYDFESLKALNRFYLTSHDRIITKHNILNYCRMELDKYVVAVDVVKNVCVSHKRNKGMINVIEIRITPRPEHVEYLKSSGILKDIRIRLIQRSPDTFNYRIILY
jgi:hypothetical protein